MREKHFSRLCITTCGCQVWHDALRYHANKWVMSYLKEWDVTQAYVWHGVFICVTWLIHMYDMTQSYVWHGSFIYVTRPMWAHSKQEFALFYIWMSHVIHMNGSCRTYEWVMARTWIQTRIRFVLHMNESCHTYEWVMSHIWMSHVTHMNESCHTHEWDMSHIWIQTRVRFVLILDRLTHHCWECAHKCICHVTHMSKPCHTYARVTYAKVTYNSL